MKRRIQILHASINRPPPQTQIHAPITPVLRAGAARKRNARIQRANVIVSALGQYEGDASGGEGVGGRAEAEGCALGEEGPGEGGVDGGLEVEEPGCVAAGGDC